MNSYVVVFSLALSILASGCGSSSIDPAPVPAVEQAPVVRPSGTPVVQDLELVVSYVHRYATYEVKRTLKQFGEIHLADRAVSLPVSRPDRIRVRFEVPRDLKHPESLLMNASYGCGHSSQGGVSLRTPISEVSAVIDNERLFFASELERIQDAFFMCRSDRVTLGLNLYSGGESIVFERQIQIHLIQEPKNPKAN